MAYIISKTENHITTIILNRSEKLNAFNSQMMEELTAAVEKAGKDLDTHVILITSACEKAFSAGGDLQEEKNLTSGNAEYFACTGQACMDAIYYCPVPVILVAHGYALGAAMELILAADFTIASEDMVIGMPAINLAGLTAFGCTTMLSRTVGYSRTADILYTGRNFFAREALEMGLIEYVFPREELMEKTMAIAQTMADRSPATLCNMKKLLHDGNEVSFEEARKMETKAFVSQYDLEDRREALRAFLEKRPHKPYCRKK